MLSLPLHIMEGCVEAIGHKDKRQWAQAIEGDIDSLDKNNMRVLVEKPKEQNIVGVSGYSTKKKALKK